MAASKSSQLYKKLNLMLWLRGVLSGHSVKPFKGEATDYGRFCPVIGVCDWFCGRLQVVWRFESGTQCSNRLPTGQQAGQAGHQSASGDCTPELT